MTKKKTKNDSDVQYSVSRPKTQTIANLQPKTIRSNPRIVKAPIQKAKQTKTIIAPVKTQQRKHHEQKYRENLIQKKQQQEKRRFMTIKYNDQLNSEWAQLNQDSLSRRAENETIIRIKQLLQAQQLNQNKKTLSMTAQTQYAKIQQFAQRISQINNGKENKQNQNSSNKIQQIQKDLLNDLGSLFPKENISQKAQNQPKTIIQKIFELQQIYY